jgi:hypothetical protein
VRYKKWKFHLFGANSWPILKTSGQFAPERRTARLPFAHGFGVTFLQTRLKQLRTSWRCSRRGRQQIRLAGFPLRSHLRRTWVRNPGNAYLPERSETVRAVFASPLTSPLFYSDGRLPRPFVSHKRMKISHHMLIIIRDMSNYHVPPSRKSKTCASQTSSCAVRFSTPDAMSEDLLSSTRTPVKNLTACFFVSKLALVGRPII